MEVAWSVHFGSCATCVAARPISVVVVLHIDAFSLASRDHLWRSCSMSARYVDAARASCGSSPCWVWIRRCAESWVWVRIAPWALACSPVGIDSSLDNEQAVMLLVDEEGTVRLDKSASCSALRNIHRLILFPYLVILKHTPFPLDGRAVPDCGTDICTVHINRDGVMFGR